MSTNAAETTDAQPETPDDDADACENGHEWCDGADLGRNLLARDGDLPCFDCWMDEREAVREFWG